MSPEPFFALATVLFCIGLIGTVSRKNLFVIYMSIELMLNAVNLILATFARLHGESAGSVIVLFIIALTAAEAAVFLAMILHLSRTRQSIDSDDFDQLKHRKESL